MQEKQMELQEKQMELLERQLKLAERPIETPKIKPPKPMAPAGIPQNSADASYAAQEARRRAMRRTNAGRNTLFAGETGGFRHPVQPKPPVAGPKPPPKTLLG